MIKTVEWTNQGVRFIDQRRLPTEELYVVCKSYETVAPAIGVSAAMGVALGMQQSTATDMAGFSAHFDRVARLIGETRPTAVNLFWGIRRMKAKLDSLPTRTIPQIKDALVAEAQLMLVEDIAANEAMGKHGAVLMPSSGGVLTHCNAGALATCGYGTALGVIRAAVE